MQPTLAPSARPAAAPTGGVRPERSRRVLALCAGVLGLGLAACSKPEPPKPPPRPPAEVRVITSRTETVPVIQEHVGRVAAYRSVEVRARVEGIL